jgi:hypothetical protein
MLGHPDGCQCSRCSAAGTQQYPAVVMYMAGIPFQPIPGVSPRPALTEEEMRKVIEDLPALKFEAAPSLEEQVAKLVKFIDENYPGAHQELESYLTDTVPRILRSQRRLLRKAGIGENGEST